MSNHKVSALLVVMTVLYIFSSLPVYAVESSPSNPKRLNIGPYTNKFSNLQDNLKNNFQDRIARRCEIITNNIDNRINAYNNKKNAHLKRYENLKNLVSKIIANLEEKGYEVTELKTALNELDTKIKKYASDYDAFIDALKNTQNYACGESEGAFLNALEASKTALQTVLQDTRDIHSYYIDVIKKAVSDLRDQKTL
ncbi:hypothetical protein A3F07_01410 [candidate division WWE3 bacterium RIFCSPHIGHO2_12_FULL_38_15]|uniref:Uncharacterized protein n=1 Tax=candidate division WWE3 bacterium RIFCSPHIGHO2_02_FULL_38_14 TaxID=1802620 RepID=A0A1F4V961_UNCKA|nr:MAG: hypothetical protein A2793_01885 [candidate division WWE3 bacterium RIFCSPHIGHO2_01_FULL_38_45]OGC48364.1 MAG: hypothetical protein A3F07_01410 [candidate division WWE3 bacterium RIFCSPHIGHO2_12_FULL_38_15]OGC53658.1 MAG: hypothetical protein A3D91_04440 [candidate division WWE3 bacterium RIFCSPHIGHO2_02_FULL_38_14]OGC54299.1 MAG: hypothetical protein A3B64_02210 [candidate division WWE3 bacterium RIFCSPLOWO2_01_FULL_37_24]HLB51543.1 hypothetical protein [Patescibacteria group bacterium